MAAPVVAQHPELARQRLGLPVPHVQVRAQRIAERQPRPTVAVDAVVQAMRGQVEERHRPQTRSTASATPMPTPTHSVARPRLPPVFSSWCRSEEHTSELQSLMRTPYAVFCFKKKTKYNITTRQTQLTHIQTQ